MDQSEIRNKISSFCLTFSGLPTDTDVNPQTIVSNVRGANNAHLLRTASGDEKWLILFNSKNDVEDYLKNLQIDLQLNDNTYEVKVEKSVPCDIPAEWSNQECFNWLQQSGQCQGQFPSQNYFHQQPQEFQQGQHQGHVSSQTYQFPGAQEFQQAHQGGITTQGQQQQMYPGPYYPNPYCIPPFQYPYSPTQGQSNYQNVPQTQNNNNLFQGFPQPGYPHVGPTFYENTRYYNNGMYGNYGRPYLQHGQRPPPPPYQQINATYSNQMAATAQNDSSTHMHHVQMTPEATIQQSQMTPTAPNEASKQQSHMTPNAPYDDTTQVQINPTGAYDSENESSEETLKKQEPYPQMSHDQQYYTPMPMPMPSAPWEVSTGKKEVVDTEIYETRNVDSDPEKTSMIKVSNLPRNTTVDSLIFFFENRRVFGGGSIKDVDFDDSDFTAIITFEESDAVERVLQKLPILFCGKRIEVEAFYPGGKEEYQDYDKSNDDENEDEHYTSCTLEVHGVHTDTSDDTVELYFENTKRSAGGEISHTKREEKVFFITFKEEEVAQRVLAHGNHKIDGIKLEVKQYIPPPPPKPRPMYEDKVFITGMNPETTTDCLSNFLEAKISTSPSEIVYGEEEGTALVTFEEKPDIEKLILACKKRALEKHFLSISRVPVTNCIMVTGFGDKTSKDTIELYFENTKRSGGGDIEKIEMNEDDNTCLVYFSDVSVLENVVKRSHSIDRQKLNVRIHHECLGQVEIDEEQDISSGLARTPKFKVPDPLIISDINPKKLEFLLHSEAVKTGVEKQMSTCQATVEWPTTNHDPLKITCTLSTDVKDYKKLAKSWKKSTLEILDQFLNAINIEKIDILQEAWDLVLDGLKSLNVTHPDGVTISIDKTATEIFVVGYKNIIDEVSKQVKQIVNKVTEELDRKKKQVVETVNIDKPYQLRILRLIQFQNKMADKFQGIKVKINMKKNEITFEGLTGDITQAKLEMYVLFQSIVSTKVGKFSDEKLKFLESVEVKKYISTILRQATVNAVWDIDAQQNVIMYSLSDDEGVKGAHILKDAIVETPISLKEEALCLLQSQKWQKAKWEIENRAPGLINIIPEADKSQVLIYTVSDYAGEVREKMEDFLHSNTIYEKQMSGPSGKMRFLLQYQKVNIDKIAKELKEHQVSIIIDSVKIRIRGTNQGLTQAMAKIDDIVDMVKQKTHLIKKLSLAKHLLTDAGQESIKRVEKDKMCVIEPEPLYSSSSQDDGFEIIEKIDKSDYQDLATCVTLDGQRIMVRKGDITKLDVDVLVNAANKDLQHVGGLAKIIVEKGGPAIQIECNDFIKRNHGRLYEGEIYCSAPGNLKCKLIVHAVGPIWQGGNQNEAELLREVVFKSLEESEAQGHKSIAIPALCSGIFGYPVSKATKVITESVRDFFRDNQPVYIKDVFLCDINEDNVEEFIKGLIKAFGKGNVQQHNKGKSSTTWTTLSNRKAGKSSDMHSSGKRQQLSTKLCKINIRIVKGQIAQQQVDIIVNSTARNLNLTKGAVSNSVLQTGGPSLQMECSTNYPNGIQFGEVAETNGGNLQCSKVLHGSIPSWDVDGAALGVLRTFMDNCLTLVNQYGCSSVAFPALGTGNLNFPKDVVAKEMFQCVIDFSSNQPNSSVTEVKFVLYDKDIQTVQAFEAEANRRNSDEESDEGGSLKSRKGRHFSSNVNPIKHGGHQPRRQTQQPSHHGGHGNHGYRQEAHDGGQITVGKLKLKVYQGDITKARADVIVNSTNSELDLTRGAVAQAILKKGGKEMMGQIQLNKEKMKRKGIVTTTSGKDSMPCDYIIHVNAEDKSIMKGWEKKIIKILQKADKLNVKTVAFPALGTGQGIKIEEIADSLFDAMIEFQNSSFQSLKEVHMVIFQSQMMNSFIDQIKTCVNTKGKKSKGIFATIGSWLGFNSNDSKDETTTVGRGEGNNAPENQLQSNQDLVSVKLKIYANEERTLDDAKDMIVAECENLIKTKVFEEKIIKEFSEEEEKSVRELYNTYGIEVKLEKRIGRLRLTGLLQDIMPATSDVYDIIRQAERKKQHQQEAKLYAEFVKWYFIEVTMDGNQLEEYPNSINLKLEMAYKNQEKDVRFCDDQGREYTVDLNKLIEYPTDDPNDQVTVIRKDLVKDSTFEPPATWDSMNDKENILVIDLKPGSPEYQMVISNFQQQAGQVNIIKCQRIQNRSLYQQYVAKKKSIDAQNPSTVVNEKMLWHGTAGNAVDSINAYGFNRSYCGKNAVVHGNGVYFAANAAYSCRTTYSPPDPSTGQRHIYQCKVLTGEFAQGQQGMRVPPNKPSTSGAASHILYDSVVDNVNSPGIFVIFNDTQAYPEYHILFG